MKLIFPNLQNQEGKTLCQLFVVDFLRHLRDNMNTTIRRVDLNHMVSEIAEDLDLDRAFKSYLEDVVFKESLEVYPHTEKMIRRGKVDLAKKAKKLDAYTKNVFEPSGDARLTEISERLFAGHITALSEIRSDISSNRCVQNSKETGIACGVCGLVNGKTKDITERVSLVADKCWKPRGQYEQLKACVRCAYVLGIIANLRILWRINIDGKDRKSRFSVVPSLNIAQDNTDPAVLDDVEERVELLGLFRPRSIGTTSTDYIFNSLRSQPIIAKIVKEGKIDLNVYIQSKEPLGGYTTQNVIGPEKIQKIAEFATFMSQNFPRYGYADSGARPESARRILGETAFLYTTKGRSKVLCYFFTRRNTNFKLLEKILGGGKNMKTEYFKNPERIKDMSEYEWDNPLVRISTFFVAERANEASKKGLKPDQAINSPMALFNSVPENEKNKTVRQFVEEITNHGNSYFYKSIDRPEEFLSEFSKALNACKVEQLKEMVRWMRMFVNSFMYWKGGEKTRYHKETVKELGYNMKEKEVA